MFGTADWLFMRGWSTYRWIPQQCCEQQDKPRREEAHKKEQRQKQCREEAIKKEQEDTREGVIFSYWRVILSFTILFLAYFVYKLKLWLKTLIFLYAHVGNCELCPIESYDATSWALLRFLDVLANNTIIWLHFTADCIVCVLLFLGKRFRPSRLLRTECPLVAYKILSAWPTPLEHVEQMRYTRCITLCMYA